MIYVISILWCVSFYFPINIPIGGGLFLPTFPFFILAILHAARGIQYRKVALLISGVLAYTIANIFLVESSVTALDRRLLSGLQLPYTIFNMLVIGFSKPYSKGEVKIIFKTMLFFVSCITIYGLLEPFSILSSISDQFRDAVYSADQIYSDHNRDMQIAGRIRPKAFASEPSQASWAIWCISISMFTLKRDPKSRVTILLLLLMAVGVFLSPANAFGLIVLTGCYLYESRRASLGAIIGIGVSATVLITILVLVAKDFLFERYVTGSILDEGSTFVRIIQPFSMAWIALQHDPFFGVGFGGLEEIWYSIELIEGGEYSEKLNMSAGAAILTIPLFCGLSGVLGFTLLYRRLLADIEESAKIGFSALFLFSLLSKSSIVVTQSWYIVSFYLLVRPACAGVSRLGVVSKSDRFQFEHSRTGLASST
jgi:hypothetical protein